MFIGYLITGRPSTLCLFLGFKGMLASMHLRYSLILPKTSMNLLLPSSGPILNGKDSAVMVA